MSAIDLRAEIVQLLQQERDESILATIRSLLKRDDQGADFDNLTRVRTHNDLEQWFKFFLVGVIGTADKATNGLREILRLKQDCLEQRIPSIGIRSTSGPRLLEYLFQQPVVNAEMVSEAIGQTPPSAYKLIAAFEQVGILREITGSKWGRIYRFEEYFKVFE